MLHQRTIKNPIKAVGVGLHSGKEMNLELLPAPINAGITFIRTDLEPDIEMGSKNIDFVCSKNYRLISIVF